VNEERNGGRGKGKGEDGRVKSKERKVTAGFDSNKRITSCGLTVV
jgi:hypothetical protein